MIKYNALICRYHEIATKGNNRMMFENCLMDNLRMLLEKFQPIKINRVRGRIMVRPADADFFTQEFIDVAPGQLEKCFGMESFSPAIMVESAYEPIADKLGKSVEEYFSPYLTEKLPVSFRIRARRSFKDFPMDSKEIEIALAEIVSKKIGEDNLTVNLNKADVSIGCEVREEFAFLFYDTFKCPGGLPVGCNNPVLALLSGGIDSPVACYMLMKRGSRVNYLTFHSSPYTPPETVEKVKRLVKILNSFQKPGKLHICNLSPFQKLVRDNCKSDYRTVLYRRAMFRIAQAVAEKNKYAALLTGESVGQVASQTISNLTTINSVTDMLVLRPLIGMDKVEAIRMAEKIGTFDISCEQVPDSCTVFAPGSPATSTNIWKIEKEESRIVNYDEILNSIINDIEIMTFN